MFFDGWNPALVDTWLNFNPFVIWGGVHNVLSSANMNNLRGNPSNYHAAIYCSDVMRLDCACNLEEGPGTCRLAPAVSRVVRRSISCRFLAEHRRLIVQAPIISRHISFPAGAMTWGTLLILPASVNGKVMRQKFCWCLPQMRLIRHREWQWMCRLIGPSGEMIEDVEWTWVLGQSSSQPVVAVALNIFFLLIHCISDNSMEAIVAPTPMLLQSKEVGSHKVPPMHPPWVFAREDCSASSTGDGHNLDSLGYRLTIPSPIPGSCHGIRLRCRFHILKRVCFFFGGSKLTGLTHKVPIKCSGSMKQAVVRTLTVANGCSYPYTIPGRLYLKCLIHI